MNTEYALTKMKVKNFPELSLIRSVMTDEISLEDAKGFVCNVMTEKDIWCKENKETAKVLHKMAKAQKKEDADGDGKLESLTERGKKVEDFVRKQKVTSVVFYKTADGFYFEIFFGKKHNFQSMGNPVYEPYPTMESIVEGTVKIIKAFV